MINSFFGLFVLYSNYTALITKPVAIPTEISRPNISPPEKIKFIHFPN